MCTIGPKGKVRTHCYVCDANFAVRVKLRRHIRSGPLKPAPAICFYIFGISCETMRLSRLEVGWRKLSNKTSKLILFGGGDNFQTRQRDCLEWGWGGGGEYCQARQASSSRLEVGWGWRKLSNEKSCCFSRDLFA